jgi:hypothetical protein
MASKQPVSEEQIKNTANALIEKIKASSSMALSYVDIKRISQKVITAIEDEKRTSSSIASSGIGLKEIRTAYITNRKELNEINSLISKLRKEINSHLLCLMKERTLSK